MDVYRFFKRFEELNPTPKTELDFYSPFTALVAVVLSAQSTDKGVNKATPALFKTADTPEKMLELGEEGICEYIKTIGLYKNKAKNLYRLSKMLVDDYGGKVPDSEKELVKLPGVGRKTANVVLNEVFSKPAIAVDTHVFRVCNRTGLAVGKNPDEVEAELNRVVPDEFKNRAHHWLVLHGRYVCKARKPDCENCPVADLCEYA